MSIELRVPEVGESITEVQIGDWLVDPGGSADREESVVVIETDKVTVELPAPVAGIVTKILKATGERAEVGELIGYMEEADGAEAEESDAGEKGKSKDKGKKKKSAAKDEKESESEGEAEAEKESAAKKKGEKEQEGESHVMPAAKRALATSGVDPSTVRPTGPGGRTLKEDVQRAEKTKGRADAGSAGDLEEVVPMTPMRRRIAERLVEAQQTAALLTTFNEVDMTKVMALRKEHKESFQEKHGVKLGFMSFFVKAAIEALKLVPQVNAEIRGEDIVYRNHFDIGVAVGGGKGLVVPVLRRAERMSFAEVESTIGDLAQRAANNKITLDELQGGTFTISNGGVYGSLLSTPIVNPPQSGILGLHAIQDRPVAIDGQVVVRPMMYVALTYDHRIVDGREAVTFLKHIKHCVESPERILLEI